MDSPRVIALVSGKGGVGKSTLALALGAAYRDAGARVALVDFDPQGGLTLAAGLETPADPYHADAAAVHGMALWPSGRALAAVAAQDLSYRLVSACRAADIVIVDCSPALTDAAHAAVLPLAGPVVVVAKLDAAGLPNVDEAVALAEAQGRPVRVVPTFKGTTGLARESEAFLRGRHAGRVTRAVIPTDAKAAEAPGRGAPVLDTAPRAKVSEAVRALAVELAPEWAVAAPSAPAAARSGGKRVSAHG